MLTGFASMRFPPVDDVVLGLSEDEAPGRCARTCAPGIVSVPRQFVHCLWLTSNASGAAPGARSAPSVHAFGTAMAHTLGCRETQVVSQPEDHIHRGGREQLLEVY